MAIVDSATASQNARIKIAFQLAFHVPFWALLFLGVAALGGTNAVRAGGASRPAPR